MSNAAAEGHLGKVSCYCFSRYRWLTTNHGDPVLCPASSPSDPPTPGPATPTTPAPVTSPVEGVDRSRPRASSFQLYPSVVLTVGTGQAKYSPNKSGLRRSVQLPRCRRDGHVACTVVRESMFKTWAPSLHHARSPLRTYGRCRSLHSNMFHRHRRSGRPPHRGIGRRGILPPCV